MREKENYVTHDVINYALRSARGVYPDGVTGEELRRLRKAARLTQGALARRLGVRKNTVYRYEAGTIRITTSMARLIRLVLAKGKAPG